MDICANCNSCNGSWQLRNMFFFGKGLGARQMGHYCQHNRTHSERNVSEKHGYRVPLDEVLLENLGCCLMVVTLTPIR